MSKKISSTSKYLGISRDWFVNFQHYGNFYLNFFFSFLNIYNLLNFIIRNVVKTNIFVLKKQIYLFFNTMELNLNLFYLKRNVNLTNLFYNKINSILLNNFFFNVKINFFSNNFNFFSKQFLEAYLEYLSFSNSPKTIFNLVIVLLKNQINKTTIFFFNSGLRKIQLKGFKIQLKGRYELSKSTLAKKQFLKFGQVTSNNLNNLLDLLNKDFYSKLGKSTLKIWFFYL
uniref:ribosomal protein S3 n=1 Tax=Palisada intermedia TaxID=397057 RepID=UPI00286B89FC|nr:ribosomal protein S3 [Palisada intermedia]WMC20771.1 ribosomal protein S3 [Palisada intermedia]